MKSWPKVLRYRQSRAHMPDFAPDSPVHVVPGRIKPAIAERHRESALVELEDAMLRYLAVRDQTSADLATTRV
jgi:hypothetical protein